MQGGPWPTVFALAPKERWAKARPTVLGFIAASLCQRRLRLRRSGSLSCEPVEKHVVSFDSTEIAGGAQVQMRFTFECEGAPKPSCVSENLFRYYE